MKKNIKPMTNRDKIIETSKIQFYDNGISNTSLDDIATLCQITKPLITYHFGTKSNLVKEVIVQYMIGIKNHVTEKIYSNYDNYNLLYSSAAEMMLVLKLYNEDPKAKRFYCEYLNSGFENQFSESFMDFYKIHDRRYHLQLDQASDEITMLAIASMFAGYSLMYSYFTGKLKSTFEQFNDYTARIPFQFMKVEEDRIDIIISEGKKILEKLDFKFHPYFIIE